MTVWECVFACVEYFVLKNACVCLSVCVNVCVPLFLYSVFPVCVCIDTISWSLVFTTKKLGNIKDCEHVLRKRNYTGTRKWEKIKAVWKKKEISKTNETLKIKRLVWKWNSVNERVSINKFNSFKKLVLRPPLFKRISIYSWIITYCYCKSVLANDWVYHFDLLATFLLPRRMSSLHFSHALKFFTFKTCFYLIATDCVYEQFVFLFLLPSVKVINFTKNIFPYCWKWFINLPKRKK